MAYRQMDPHLRQEGECPHFLSMRREIRKGRHTAVGGAGASFEAAAQLAAVIFRRLAFDQIFGLNIIRTRRIQFHTPRRNRLGERAKV
jgi:hypothetical protein